MTTSKTFVKSWLLLGVGLFFISLAKLSAQVTVSPTYPSISTFLWGNTSVNAVGKTSFVSGTGYGYRYIIPQNYKSTTKYPAIIFLHGEGEDGTDNVLPLSAGNNTANGVLALVSTANPNNQANYPCFFIVPQQPVGALWSSAAGATAIQNLLHIFQTQYPNSFDTSRIYLTGLSNGGTGAYDMPYLLEQSTYLGHNPFAAIVPMSASFGLYIERNVVSQPFMPMWVFHGAADTNAPIGPSDDTVVPAFRALGFSVVYSRYLTGMHNIWGLAYQHPLLLPWLFSQQLNQSAQGSLSNFAVTSLTQSSGPVLNLSGTASTAEGYTGLTWSNTSNSQSGTASGSLTPTWGISSIPLVTGTNALQVTASAPNNTALVSGTATNYGGTLTVNLPLFVSPSLNVALNKTVTVSSTDAPGDAGTNAVDGSITTRWSSLYTDPQWIEVDLGAYYAISEIDLNWESGCGKNYQIQTSNDGIVWTTQTNVTGNTTSGLLQYPYSTPPTARYVRMYGTARATQWGYSLYEFSVYSNGIQQPPPTNVVTNIAIGKPVTVSSTDSSANNGPNAVDGNTSTRWSSAYSDPQWIVVDLGANYNISEIDLNWETACGKDYQIQTSTDNATWTTQTSVTGNTTSGLLQYTYSTPISGRYVRMYGTARATVYGYSLWEFSVYSDGTLANSPPPTSPPTITNGPPPTTGTTGIAYSFGYNSSGSPTPTFSLTSGTLPPGLSLSSAGVLAGTPTSVGAYTGTVTASNGVNPAATQNFSITVNPPPVAPLFTDGPPPTTGTSGTAYTFSYTASGSPTPTFSVTSGSLPPGLSLSSAGVLSGTPTSVGAYTGTVTASNGVNPVATQNFSITVNPPQVAPLFTDGPPPTTGTSGTAYSFSYTASGYPAPTFSVTSGSLPPGLSLSSAGVISGTPTSVGSYSGTVTASNGVNPVATQNFSITVSPAPVAPLFTDGPPPATGTSGTAYTFSYTASGYPAPTFSVTSGSLPTGLSLSSAGLISGTPTSVGTYSGTVTASNGVNPVATQNFSITVNPAPVAPVFTDGPPPTTGTSGTAYTFSYTASGYPAPTFSVTSGSLPTGLSLSSAGVISGTPTSVGTYTGTVTASNGVNPVATQNFSITVNPAPVAPVFTDGPPPTTGTSGTAYTFSYTASGYPAPTFSVTSGSLSPGLTLTSAGVLSGTPTSVGTYTRTVTASNGVNPVATQNFSITVSPAPVAPVFTDGPPPTTGTSGTAYTFSYTTSGYPAPTFSVTSGSLPTGLSLSSAGLISGTPTSVGTYSGTVTASNGVNPVATQNFSITVSPAPVAPVFTDGPPPTTGTSGTAYTFSYTASGYPAPTFSVTSGSLPTGLSLSSAGVISGTTTSVGTYSGTVTASNGVNPVATQNFSITVNPPPVAPVITDGPPTATGTTGVVYSFIYTASGYPAPTFNVTSGSLPPGLSLSSAGVISGTPTSVGAYTGTVTVDNGVAPAATQDFSITVDSSPVAPVFTDGPPPTTGTTGTAYSFSYTASSSPAPTYSVTSGSLPLGLTLSADGVVSGTPTSVGTFTGTVTADNGVAPAATQDFSITVNPPPVAPVFTDGPPPASGTTGTSYTFSYTASGYPAPTFSVTSGSLPPGLSLSSVGVISGTPTSVGTFTGTVTAGNGVLPATTQNFSITVNPAPVAPVFTDGPPPASDITGTAYSFSYTASGYPAPTFSVTSGSLPLGVTLSSAGVISGTPTSVGTFTGTVTADNGVAPAATQNFSITVSPAPVAPVITDGPPPATGTSSTSYTFSYTASGYPAPTFSVTSGSLPPGLSLSSAGVISGTPTGLGAYTGTVTASNGVNPAATQNFSITVNPAPVAPVITDGPPPATGTSGTAYSFSYTASGSPAPTFSVTSGSLPPGLSLSSAGVLSGTPTGVGAYTGTVTASNGVNPAATQNFSITVSSALVAPVITDGPPPATGTSGTAYSFSYTASGSPAPTFSVTSGSLPPGLSLSSAGVLSGAPTGVGAYTGTVTASNGVAPAATQNFSITVSPQSTAGTNLALNKPVTVSSTDSAANAGANAVDGSTTTRWSSAYSDPQWIEVDLGAYYAISEIDLNWETACGKNYQLQTSNDNVTWTTQTTVTGNTTSGLLKYTYSTPPTARYVRMYGTARATQWGYSLYEFSVYSNGTQLPPPTTNLALNQPVTVSSTDSAANAGANAVDGSIATRWSSAYSDPQWIVVDLGATHSISEVDLNWETACGKNYQIQTSSDNVTWTTQTTVTGNATSGLLKYTYSTPPKARYIRMYGTARATGWGYSLYEFSVYGQ